MRVLKKILGCFNLVVVVLLVCLASGCGNKGDLVLPQSAYGSQAK